MGGFVSLALEVISLWVPMHGQVIFFQEEMLQFEVFRGGIEIGHYTINDPGGLIDNAATCQTRAQRPRYVNQGNRYWHGGRFAGTWRTRYRQSVSPPRIADHSLGPDVVSKKYSVVLSYAMFPIWVVTILFFAWPSVALWRGPLRRHWRRKRAQCLCCGYNLTGNTSGICPECGTPIPDEIKEKLTANPPQQ